MGSCGILGRPTIARRSRPEFHKQPDEPAAHLCARCKCLPAFSFGWTDQFLSVESAARDGGGAAQPRIPDDLRGSMELLDPAQCQPEGFCRTILRRIQRPSAPKH